MFGLAILGGEGVGVDAPLVLLGRLLQKPDGYEVADVVLGILRAQLRERKVSTIMMTYLGSYY